MFSDTYNSIVVLGPTAVGKTAVAVQLADHLGGEIISADSRQVYRGLDIGSGKDLCEFTLPADTAAGKPERTIPSHLLDVTDLSEEFSVFNWQQRVYDVFPRIIERGNLPVICGGTGMYLDSFVRGYQLLSVPTNVPLRNSLNGKSDEELIQMLSDLKGGNLHNHTDTDERHRLIRAIEIEVYQQEHGSDAGTPDEKGTGNGDGSDNGVYTVHMTRPDIRPFIIGTTFPRDLLRAGIERRLKARFEEGMIDEVKGLHDAGFSWERMERLGLEYRFISEFLEGKIPSYEELYRQLNIAIGQFAKRQETWYRRMEKMGVKINWLPCDGSSQQCSVEWRTQQALAMINSL